MKPRPYRKSDKRSPESNLVFDIVFQLFRQKEIDRETYTLKPSSRMFFYSEDGMDDELILDNLWSECLKLISDKEAKVLRMFYWDRALLREIGKCFGVGVGRAQDIKTKALTKLGKKIGRICPSYFNIMRP